MSIKCVNIGSYTQKPIELVMVSKSISRCFFLFGKMLSLLWQISDIIGLIFIVANGLNLFYCSCAYFLFKSVQPNLEHVRFNDLLFDGQNKLLHPLQSLFCRGQIKPIFLRLDLCRLHHLLVAGPVIAKIGICLDELVKSYQGGQELAEFFEENLNLRK